MVLCRGGVYDRRRRLELALDARGLGIGCRAFNVGYGRLRRGAGSCRTRIRTRSGGVAGSVLLLLLRALLLFSLLLVPLLLIAFLLLSLLLFALLLFPLLLVSLLLIAFLLFPLLLITLLLVSLLLVSLLLFSFLLFPLLLVSLLLVSLLLLLLLIGLPIYSLRRNGDQRHPQQEHCPMPRLPTQDSGYRESSVLMRHTFRHSCRLGFDDAALVRVSRPPCGRGLQLAP